MTSGYSYPQLRWQSVPFHVYFSSIASPQKDNTPFQVTLEANNPHYNGTVYLDSNRGRVSPDRVNLVNGQWTGNITVYTPGQRVQLLARWQSAETGPDTNASHFFNVTNANGTLPNNATLMGTITNNAGIAISSGSVELYTEMPSDSGATAAYSTTSNQAGQYRLSGMTPGQYYIQFTSASYRPLTTIIQLAQKRAVTKSVRLNAPFPASQLSSGVSKVPVLLVPGIMGSTIQSFGTIYPRLPFAAPAWDSQTLSLLDPVWKVGWWYLEDALEKQGYQRGYNLFTVPYDWTLPVTQIRNQYLIPWIRYAEAVTGSKKVDIIAHSMGGLVTRSYIQSPQYQGDVQKFAMVGTPNEGATTPYYIWEGGNPIAADNAMGNNGWTSVAKYFYTNTLSYLAKDRYDETPCQFGWFYRYTPSECNNQQVYRLLHEGGLSVGQLMPIYSHAIINANGDGVTIAAGENTLVKALNNTPCLTSGGQCYPPGSTKAYQFDSPQLIMTSGTMGVQTHFFIGIHQATPESITVRPQPAGYTGKLYRDGIPTALYQSSQGDGTVLKSSVDFMSGIPITDVAEGHGKLIGAFVPQLVSFITGESLQHIQAALPKAVPASASYLIFKTTGDVAPQVSFINKQGHPQTITPQVSYGLNHSEIVLKQPLAGRYHITVASLKDTDYRLSVTYINPRRHLLRGGTFEDAITSGNWGNFDVTFGMAPGYGSFKRLFYGRKFYAPKGLSLTEVNGKVRLSWRDPAGKNTGDVTGYKVYVRSDANPYYHLLTTVSRGLSYLTGQDWSQVGKDIYVVKAVLNNGLSTVFSTPSFYVAS